MRTKHRFGRLQLYIARGRGAGNNRKFPHEANGIPKKSSVPSVFQTVISFGVIKLNTSTPQRI
jgi:hypothetical protein